MENNSTKIHGIYIGIIVVIVLAMAGGFYYLHKQTTMRYAMMQGASAMKGRPAPGKGMMGMMMPVTPPAESDQQKQQLVLGTEVSSAEKTFNITAGNFYFVPNKITVNKGDKVTLVMTNAGGFHDLVIEGLGLKTPVLKTANASSVSFTATQSGSYVYYCDVSDHHQKGMWGTLVVQ